MEESCTALVRLDKGTPAMADEIKESLEGHDATSKIAGMNKAIMLLLLNDDDDETYLPNLLTTVVRYVLPSEDITVQKLLLLYLEIIINYNNKTTEALLLLHLLPDIVTIIRHHLHNPNDYIRGLTLHFLSRISHAEIVQPLIPSVLSNLDHPHPFVRRNVVLAVVSLYRLPNADQLIPETLNCLLNAEEDPSARRNMLLVLSACSQESAASYLLHHVDAVCEWPDPMQMVALDLIRKVCCSNPSEKDTYITVILDALSTPAVIYESTSTLVSLTSVPSAIHAAVRAYCNLLRSRSDDNFKLIVLDRLGELKSSHREVMVDMIMEMLPSLSSPDLLDDARRKTLDIALELVTPQNVHEVVLTLKQVVIKTRSWELKKNGGEYQQMIVHAIRSCAFKFPEAATTVVHLLIDLYRVSNVVSANDVFRFVREIVDTQPKLRISIITELLDTFYQIRSSRVCICALRIIGDYCLSLSEVERGIATIKQSVGDLQLYTTAGEKEATDASKRPQRLILAGNIIFRATVCCSLIKLVLRLEGFRPPKPNVEKVWLSVLLFMMSMLQLGQPSFLPHPSIDHDSYDRIVDDLRKILQSRRLQRCLRSSSSGRLKRSQRMLIYHLLSPVILLISLT